MTEGTIGEGAWVAVPVPTGPPGKGFGDPVATATRGLGREPSSQTNAGPSEQSRRRLPSTLMTKPDALQDSPEASTLT